MVTVTAGEQYIDIDAYAGMVAYAELLNLQGTTARASSSAPLNASITPNLRSLDSSLVPYVPVDGESFVLIDVSDPDHFDRFVDQDRVSGIYDHHTGHEAYWRERLGDKAVIEKIGAACTLIYERWGVAGALDRIRPGTAALLAAGILDNTLNFNADISKWRDRVAYDTLLPYAGLDRSFADLYFTECQDVIEANLEESIRNDTKVLKEPHLPERFAQLNVWNAKQLISDTLPEIRRIMSPNGPDWVVNLISISDTCSHFIADDPAAQRQLTNLLGVEFEDGHATADRLWLRKEIMKAAQDAGQK
jgi:inorganic pyrophosphatase